MASKSGGEEGSEHQQKATVAVPEFRVVYKRDFDLAETRSSPDAHAYNRPTSAAEVHMGKGMMATAVVDVEVEERSIEIEVESAHLTFSVPLSYAVDDAINYALQDGRIAAIYDSYGLSFQAPER